MSKNNTTIWDVIKTILGFLFSKKKEKADEQKQEAQKIEQKLTEKYDKIDQKKEDQKKKEDIKDVQDDLNNIF